LPWGSIYTHYKYLLRYKVQLLLCPKDMADISALLGMAEVCQYLLLYYLVL
jgi:hypothetical protein